jgi:hypothetical protein
MPAAQVGAPPTSPGPTAADGIAIAAGGRVEIMADDVRNALVVLASARDYRMVESAIRKLDTVPLQVLIEASIVEVTLTDDLAYGVEWFFRGTVTEDGNPRSRLRVHDRRQRGARAFRAERARDEVEHRGPLGAVADGSR